MESGETGDPAATGSPRGWKPLVSVEMMRETPPGVEFPPAPPGGRDSTPSLRPMPRHVRDLPVV